MDQATVAEPVDLSQGLGNTVAVLKSKARAKSVAVAVRVEPDLPRVRGFAGELNQIWANLIDNALDAVPESGRVEVVAGRESGRVVVRIVDNGAGIPGRRSASESSIRSSPPSRWGRAPGSASTSSAASSSTTTAKSPSSRSRAGRSFGSPCRSPRPRAPRAAREQARPSRRRRRSAGARGGAPRPALPVPGAVHGHERGIGAGGAHDGPRAEEPRRFAGDVDQRSAHARHARRTKLLARSREVYPLARRVLLTAYSDIDAAIQAINEAHLDHYLSKPWDPPEERLFPVVDDLLDAWQAEYLPEATGLRLVGHQWSPRSHAIKDFLASNLIPYRWLDVERDAEARDAARGGGRGDRTSCRPCSSRTGRVLRNPEPRQVAERLGRPLSAAFDVYDLVIVGAGPAGLAAAVYGASEGLRTLLLDRHAPGRTGGHELAHRELPRVSGRRQRQRADPPRHHAGAAARRRVPRAARSDRGLDRRRVQASRALRRT